jgi:hypothetical protein
MAAAAVPGGAPDPAMWKKWTVVYPCYIDATKKCSQGRRIAKDKCEGCELSVPEPWHPLGALTCPRRR